MSADAYVEARITVADELCADLLRSCPDGQQDEIGARDNGAARAALHCAVDILRFMSPLSGEAWYRVGVRETALRIISAVELEMYDPRSHPERYLDRLPRVDTESASE